jgi:hypothetical protein
VAAGQAIAAGLLVGDEPVAGVVLRVGAEAEAASRGGERLPGALLLLQRRHLLDRRQIAEPPAAALAAGVLEIERLPAALALEQLHRVGLPHP